MPDAAHPPPTFGTSDHAPSARIGLDVAYRILPVTGAHAAADLVVMWQHSDGALTAVVADICGHGDEAAATAALVLPVVQRQVRHSTAPNVLLERINADIGADRHADAFLATAIAALIDPVRRTMSWASAGHAPPHRLSTGAAVNGGIPGPPIGMRSFVGCTTGSCDLPLSGDGVLLFTDGLTDVRAPTGRRFGTARLTAALNHAASSSATAIAAELERRALDFGQGALTDDISIVIVRLP